MDGPYYGRCHLDMSEPAHIVGLALTVALAISAVAGGPVFGAVGPATSPDDVASSSQERTYSSVTFVHASADVRPVNVSIDGDTLLTNVSFGTASIDLNIESGVRRMTITDAESGEVLVEGNFNFVRGTDYTMVVTSKENATDGSAVQPVILVDDPSVESANQSAIRLAHFGPDVPTVDVTVQGTDRVLFDNVSANDVSNYTTVPAGDYTLEVRRATANNAGRVLTTANVSLDGATATTVFAIGSTGPQEGATNTSIGLVVTNRSIQIPEGTPTPTPANDSGG